MKTSLRSAAAEDSESVARILIETRKALMPYAPWAHSEEDVRKWVRSHLIPTSNVTIAELNSRVVALVATSTDDSYLWIDQLYVHHEMTRQGAGTQLLSLVTSSTQLPIRLYTFQENLGARRFYERHGFLAVGFTNGQANEEHCPDVLYQRIASQGDAA